MDWGKAEDSWQAFLRTPLARWGIRAALAVFVVAVSVLAWYALVHLIELYLPADGTLSTESVLLAWQSTALTLGLASVVLIWKQGKDSAKWNRLVLYHQFFDSLPARPERESFLRVLGDHNLLQSLDGIGTPLREEDVQALQSDVMVSQAVRAYLDGFEQLCGAVNCGVIDERYAMELERTRVLRIFRVFQPFIEKRREFVSQAYLELEKVAVRWAEIAHNIDARYRVEVEAEQARLARERLNRGVRPAAPG